MGKVKSALSTAVGVIVGIVVVKILWDIFSSDPAGAGHKVRDAFNAGGNFIDAIETFVRAGGWAAFLVVIGLIVFIVKMVRR